jgi:hypothetical protein
VNATPPTGYEAQDFGGFFSFLAFSFENCSIFDAFCQLFVLSSPAEKQVSTHRGQAPASMRNVQYYVVLQVL